MNIVFSLVTLIFCSTSLQADPTSDLLGVKIEKNLEDRKLPDDHPIKQELDNIFKGHNVLRSLSALKKAGFISPKERNRGVVIGRHPNLKGYLLKLYIDSKKINEMEQWNKRIKGARLIQNSLDNFGYNHIMKVPKKWIYSIPTPSKKSSSSPYPKLSLLVVEDMDIFTDEENFALYRSVINEEHLEALFNVLTSCLLSDSTWLPNIPFSHDTKISFIDTEFAGETMSIWFRLPRLSKYLSADMRAYWMNLVQTRGRHKGNDKLMVNDFDQEMGYQDSDVPSYDDDAHLMEQCEMSHY